jgi:hypothetical protein
MGPHNSPAADSFSLNSLGSVFVWLLSLDTGLLCSQSLGSVPRLTSVSESLPPFLRGLWWHTEAQHASYGDASTVRFAKWRASLGQSVKPVCVPEALQTSYECQPNERSRLDATHCGSLPASALVSALRPDMISSPLQLGRSCSSGFLAFLQHVLSTLDLVNGGRLCPRLLVSADEEAVKWKRALGDIRSILLYPIQGATVWPVEHASFNNNEIACSVSQETSHVQSDTLGEGQLHLVDVQKRWAALPGVGPGVVLLVRPDGHIAWRSTLDDLQEFAEVNEGGVLQDIFSVRHQRI